MKTVIALLTAILFVALVILVLTTLSAETQPSGAAPERLAGIPRLSNPTLIIACALIGAGILASAAASTAFLLSRRRRRRGLLAALGKRLRALQVVGYIVLILGLTFLITAFLLSILYHPDEDDADQENLLLGGEEEEEEEQAELEEYVESEPSGTTTEAVERRNRLFRILLIPVGIALFLLVLLFANRLFRSQAPQEVEEGNLDALKRELARAVRVSLRDMLRSTDYRAAVIACYARMEEILGRHGFPRRAYQTPLEYMASTLQRAARIPNGNADTPKELLPDKALLDLTRLFEVAKFSTHPMSRKDMDRAVGYLTEIGDRLSTEVFRAEEVAG